MGTLEIVEREEEVILVLNVLGPRTLSHITLCNHDSTEAYLSHFTEGNRDS